MVVGHCVSHVDDESGVGRVVCEKRQLFGETNKNKNCLSAVVLIAYTDSIGDNKDNINTHAMTMMMVMVEKALFLMARPSRAVRAYLACSYSRSLCSVWCKKYVLRRSIVGLPTTFLSVISGSFYW